METIDTAGSRTCTPGSIGEHIGLCRLGDITYRRLMVSSARSQLPHSKTRSSRRRHARCCKARVRAMGIRDRPTAFRSPWQNGYVERLIGSIRRECIDHLIVVNAEHLRRILAKYATYYNEGRTHLSLGKDAPYTRPIERFGDIVCASDPWRVAPSVRSNLVFGSDTRVGARVSCAS